MVLNGLAAGNKASTPLNQCRTKRAIGSKGTQMTRTGLEAVCLSTSVAGSMFWLSSSAAPGGAGGAIGRGARRGKPIPVVHYARRPVVSPQPLTSRLIERGAL
jgi:hypothetical protein